MAGRGQGPSWADPPVSSFRAQDGDTMPAAANPGYQHPGYEDPGFQDSGYQRPRYQQPGYQQPGYQQPGGARSAGPGRPPPRRRGGRVIRRILAVLGVIVLLIIVGFGGLLLLTPSAGDAQQLARAQDRAHGVAYPGPPVPARFAKSLVATEDHRFYSDPGVDPFAVGRVVLGYLKGNGGQQGGATITQQLAKMLYTPGASNPTAEAEQVAMAIKLNFTYSKAQILQMYADVAYYGQNYYSLGAASCGYFGVPPSGMTWSQAALMAGIVQAPSSYDPLVNPAAAHSREAHVLGRLVATGVLTKSRASAALSQPLDLVPRAQALAPPPHGSADCGSPAG
jgi:membrane peptidoglycan carboxypeptidase